MDEILGDFEKLYRLFYRRMVAYVSGFKGVDEHERSDLAHDILVHAWMKRERYKPAEDSGILEERKRSAWVYALAHNFVVDHVRRNGFRLQSISNQEDTADERTRTPEDESAASDLMRLIKGEMAKMNDRDREIAQLVFYEHMSAAETGRIMIIPAATVRWRLAEMRKKLKPIIEEAI